MLNTGCNVQKNIATSYGTYVHNDIALDQHFFARNGVSVTIRNYDQGLDAINSMLNGDVDIVAASEFPIVGKAFKKERVWVIATLDKVEAFYVIGRKDSGIENISGLKGKRVGLRVSDMLEEAIRDILKKEHSGVKVKTKK